ncbi:MAG: hypothetical protein HZA00_12850 [Nitrospinae bacterium]|nr:hypothetical protein [Nitrospinota bacterium]
MKTATFRESLSLTDIGPTRVSIGMGVKHPVIVILTNTSMTKTTLKFNRIYLPPFFIYSLEVIYNHKLYYVNIKITHGICLK